MAKQDYKQIVLEYLLQHCGEDIERTTLIQDTGISKSRLSEIIQDIRNDGHSILTPPRSGMIRLESASNEVAIPSIKDSDFRKWLILFLLSYYGRLTFRELILRSLQVKEYGYIHSEYLLSENSRKAYDDNHLIKSLRVNASNEFLSENEIDVASDIISVTTLRKDLTVLRNQGIVRQHKARQITYELTETSPYIIPISGDSLFRFCQEYEDNISSMSELVPIKQAYHKIQSLLCFSVDDKKQRSFGKLNLIDQTQIQSFNTFINSHYKTNRIRVNSSFQGRERHDSFSVALLYYSVETGHFYALGKNHTQSRIEAIRLDFIDYIEDLPDQNKIFHSDDYYKIYNEMFASDYKAELYHVKVLFQDFGNVPQRFQNIHMLRKTSSISVISDPPEDCIYKYIYEDDIRGIKDFERFLRSFGYSVLALEPQILRDDMIATYTMTLDFYNELEKEENG